MALVARFIATIGQTPTKALNTTSIKPASRLSSRKRSTRACSSDKMSRAEPAQPEQVQPVVGEPGHGATLLPRRTRP